MIYAVIDKKKLTLIMGVFVSLIVFSAVIYSVKNTGKDSEENNLKVVVDAGHGLPDGGTVGIAGSIESDINLDIARLLKEILEGKGIEVMMTRDSAKGLKYSNNEKWSKVSDMNIRLGMMKTSNADLFISIHMNHYPEKSVHGLRLFYSKKHPQIKQLAELMQLKMSSATGAKINTVMAADSRLFLMKSPPLPAILIECGFISNPDEEKNLLNDEYKAKLAWAIAESVEEYYIKS